MPRLSGRLDAALRANVLECHKMHTRRTHKEPPLESSGALRKNRALGNKWPMRISTIKVHPPIYDKQLSLLRLFQSQHLTLSSVSATHFSLLIYFINMPKINIAGIHHLFLL